MSDKIVLSAEKRTVTGKKVKKLREEGIVPSNIFGNKFASQSIQVALTDFMKVFKAAGETQVVYIALDKEEIPTLVRGLQLHHLTNKPLHVDFQKVDLTKKVHAAVPVQFTGESEAVHQNLGDLLHLAETLNVEALPASVPHEIEVDITPLKQVDDMIVLSDLKAGKDYTFLDDPETPIAKIAAKQEEVVAEAPEEAPAEGEGEAAEGEAPAEGGEAQSEEKPSEE